MSTLNASTPAGGPQAADSPRRPRRWSAAAAGLAAGILALGVAEVVAGLVDPSAAPIIALGDVVVDNVPAWLKDFAVNAFGTHDKLVLLGTAYLVAAALCAVAGLLAAARPPFRQAGLWLVLVLGALAALAAATRPDGSALAALPSLVGAAVGMAVLTQLVRLIQPEARGIGGDGGRSADRRAVLSLGAVAVIGVAAGGFGNWLGARLRGAQESRATVSLPEPTDPAPALPADVEVGVEGVEPFITSNADFYRIDTALSVPLLTTADWSLRIHGMVTDEITVTWADLIAGDLRERDLTLMCVSNPVGGDLTSTARFLGLPIQPLPERAGVSADADMVLSTSSDGWTASTPLQALTDGRDAMLSIGMNGEPLPLEHGFPVRMVVPGLYGYVSATKWVTDLEVTRFDRAEGYWTSRGWSERGPVKTSSRIDVPDNGSSAAAGQVVVAGIAWAEHRGINAVEVQVDDDAWEPAELGADAGVDTWRQWSFTWDASAATPGTHQLRVRATDGTAAVQTGHQQTPAPDGATGWHTIQIIIT